VSWKGQRPGSTLVPVNLTSALESDLGERKLELPQGRPVHTKKAADLRDAVADWSWVFAALALVLFVLDLHWITRSPKRAPLRSGSPPRPLRNASGTDERTRSPQRFSRVLASGLATRVSAFGAGRSVTRPVPWVHRARLVPAANIFGWGPFRDPLRAPHALPALPVTLVLLSASRDSSVSRPARAGSAAFSASFSPPSRCSASACR
jgi:hypothetical protein